MTDLNEGHLCRINRLGPPSKNSGMIPHEIEGKRGSPHRHHQYSDCIINTLPDCLVVLSSGLNIQSANRSFCTSFNIEAEQVCGHSFKDIPCEGFDTPVVLESLSRICVNHKPVQDLQVEIDIPDIGLRIIQLNAWEMHQPKTQEELILVRLTDVTDSLDRDRSDFISTVSHELRTPLTALAASLSLLKAGAAGHLPDAAQSIIAIACKNSDRLIRLVNDILDMEKLETEKMGFDFQPANLAQLLDQGVELNKPYAEKYGVDINLITANADCCVMADAQRFTQLLTNLISNAIKYSPSGEAVTVTFCELSNSARISVTDKGPGIPVEFQDHLFEKFAQANDNNPYKEKGSGLGLAIGKAIAKAHGSSLKFHTKENHGTTMYFDLPLFHSNSESLMA